MGEDRNDPRMQRNQIVSFVLIAILLAGYFYFVPPPKAPEPAKPDATQAAQAPTPPPSAVSEILPTEIAPEKLPPVAEPATDPQSDEVKLENGALRLVFTKIGARLKSATVVLGKDGVNSQELVPAADPGVLDKDRVLPLGLRFSGKFVGDALDQRRWSVEQGATGKALTFSLELPGEAKITKTFTLDDAYPLMHATVGYTNTSAAAQAIGANDHDPAFALNWGPSVTSADTLKGLHQELIWRHGSADNDEVLVATSLVNDPAPNGYAVWRDGVDWLALSSAYFVVAIKPDFEGAAPAWAQGDKTTLRFGSAAPKFDAKPGETVTRAFQVYIGPKQKEPLRAAWAGLDSTWTFYHTFLWSNSLGHAMDWFSKLLLAILNWFHDHVYANYGVAIIFLTLLVRSAVFPLTIKSMASMKKMQKLQPEMEELKTKYKDNPQEQQQKLMELYRERGVNPVAGCFPLFLQMPVFFALYRMLWTAIELRGAPFAGWIKDLAEPDRLFVFAEPVNIIFTQLHSINLLPLLMAVVMWGSTKLVPTAGPVTSPEQKMMMNFMPVMFSFFCYQQAAGLSLYIITSTLLGMAQSQIVNRIEWNVDVDKKPAKAAPTKKHWYDVALEKKKQLEKEQKDLKKRAREENFRDADDPKNSNGGNKPKKKK